MSELREIVPRLALVLGRLDDTTHLGISREGSDHFISEDGSNRYLQFAPPASRAIDWDGPLPLEEIAVVAVETLERVHGVTDLEQVRFDAAPTVLAPLHDAFRPDPRVLRIGYWD